MLDNSKTRQLFARLVEKIMLISSAEAMETKGIHEKYWVKSGERSYLFKYNVHPSDYSDFGEVFVSYLSYVLGFKCVNSVFSQDFFYEEREKSHLYDCKNILNSNQSNNENNNENNIKNNSENYIKSNVENNNEDNIGNNSENNIKINNKNNSENNSGNNNGNNSRDNSENNISNYIENSKNNIKKYSLKGDSEIKIVDDVSKNDRTYLRYGSLTESYIKNKNCEVFSLRLLYNEFASKKIGSGVLSDIVEVCKVFCEKYNVKMDDELVEELKDMALIDYLLVQEDRHGGNIEFLVEEKKGKKYLSLAPMFDNGACLHLADNYKPQYLLNDLEKPILYDLGIGKLNPSPAMYIQNKNYPTNKKDIVRDLASELLENKRLNALYENFKKLNISEEVEFLDSIYKRKLPTVYKKIIDLSIKNRVMLLEKELEKQNKKENDYGCDFAL